MRKFIIWCAFFIPTLLLAQTGSSNDKQLFVGYIAAGMNISQIAGDRMAGYRKVGANAGVGSFIMYTPFLSNSIEIAYSMKGSQTSFKNNNLSSFSKFTFDYVEIPLLLNYHEQDVAIFSAGFTFARLIRYNLENSNTLLLADPKKWDFAATVGATFLIKEKFGLGLKGNFSLNSLLKLRDNSSKARKGKTIVITHINPKINYHEKTHLHICFLCFWLFEFAGTRKHQPRNSSGCTTRTENVYRVRCS